MPYGMLLKKQCKSRRTLNNMMPLRIRSLKLILCVAAMLGMGWPHNGRLMARIPKDAGTTHAAREFSEHVGKYVKLHKKMEDSLPALKPTEDPAVIVEYQQALAKKLFQARREAKQGDIFTPAVSAEFSGILSDVFHGPDAAMSRSTVKQGEPVKAVSLQVNNTYPDGIPFTTIPPTLLQKLPPLPAEVEYRIVDRYLVLQDIKANLIVDYMDGAIPNKFLK
jgi:hypothetical protein